MRLPDRLHKSRRRTKQRVCRQSDPGTRLVDQVCDDDSNSESFTRFALTGEVCLQPIKPKFQDHDRQNNEDGESL